MGQLLEKVKADTHNVIVSFKNGASSCRWSAIRRGAGRSALGLFESGRAKKQSVSLDNREAAEQPLLYAFALSFALGDVEGGCPDFAAQPLALCRLNEAERANARTPRNLFKVEGHRSAHLHIQPLSGIDCLNQPGALRRDRIVVHSSYLPFVQAAPCGLTVEITPGYLPHNAGHQPACGLGRPAYVGALPRPIRGFFVRARVRSYGRAGREGASPAGANYRSTNPLGSAHPLGRGLAEVKTASWSDNIMAHPAQGASAPARTTTARPILERRTFPPRPASLTDLEFVADVRVGGRLRRAFWAVKPTEDYAAACSQGRQYACDFVQFMKDSPSSAGGNLLGWMAAEMAEIDRQDDANGYAVGFWSTIEVLLLQGAQYIDHYAAAEVVAQQYAAILRAREVRHD